MPVLIEVKSHTPVLASILIHLFVQLEHYILVSFSLVPRPIPSFSILQHGPADKATIALGVAVLY